MKKGIKLLLVLLWMFLIFWFSNQVGEESSNMSNTISEPIIQIIENITNYSLDRDVVHYVVRKLAHFGCYFILAILLLSYLKEYSLSKNKYYLITLFICMIYALLDEIHQSFVMERNSSIIDICIDSLGSSVALILLYFHKKGVVKNG